jgi:hypothetical protein
MVRKGKLDQLTAIVASLEIAERDFTGTDMPAVDAQDRDIPYFFAFTVLQMCGTGRKNNGEVGCSKIWKRYFKVWEQDRRFFRPAAAARTSYSEMAQILNFSECGKWVSDKDIYWRWKLHRGLGRHIARIPDFSFVNRRIASLEGFNLDPFEKKANLLRMILSSRPERFIDDNQYGPVIDFNVMRVLIRTGTIALPKKNAGATCIGRQENMMRQAAFSAVANLQVKTGKNHNQLDTLFWSLGHQVCRRDKIRCRHCPFDPVCENRTATEVLVDTINY